MMSLDAGEIDTHTFASGELAAPMLTVARVVTLPARACTTAVPGANPVTTPWSSTFATVEFVSVHTNATLESVTPD
jgi:hypothetical protein